MNTGEVVTAPKGIEGKRTWRVGSLSMGIMLILMGTALAASFWQNIESYDVLIWIAPVVFILLGAELLLYLKFSGNDRAIVHYDWISVFFVGMIGTVSLGLALLMSTGLFDELQRGLNMSQRSVFVESQTVKVPADVNKIIVQSIGGVEFGETNSREVQLFGQVRYWSVEPLERIDNSILQTKQVGSTLYIMIGTIARRDGGLISDTISPQLTLVLPKGVEVEQRGR